MKKFIRTYLPFTRVHSADKLISSRLLNKMGAQTYRIKKAMQLYDNRKIKVPEELKSLQTDLSMDGIAVLNDFLNSEMLSKLKKECEEIKNKDLFTSKREDGPNKICVVKVDELNKDAFPALHTIKNDERIQNIFSVAEKRNVDFNKSGAGCHVQLLIQENKNRELRDPETELHSDIFFNTHKAWIYLDEVTRKEGPFVFVPQSNKIHEKRLEYEYKNSISDAPQGSRRITEEELQYLGLEEKEYQCKENTFVIANTFGFHGRRMGEVGGERMTIAFNARFNPFKR